jgi:hypothetical protein
MPSSQVYSSCLFGKVLGWLSAEETQLVEKGDSNRMLSLSEQQFENPETSFVPYPLSALEQLNNLEGASSNNILHDKNSCWYAVFLRILAESHSLRKDICSIPKIGENIEADLVQLSETGLSRKDVKRSVAALGRVVSAYNSTMGKDILNRNGIDIVDLFGLLFGRIPGNRSCGTASMSESNLAIEDERTFPIIMLDGEELGIVDYEALYFIDDYAPWGIINYIKLSANVGHWVVCILGPDGYWEKYDDIHRPQKTYIENPLKVGTVSAVFLRNSPLEAAHLFPE